MNNKEERRTTRSVEPATPQREDSDRRATMGTDKEVAAFVERVAKHLSEAPHAQQNGRHRVAFVALRPLIAGALASGCTMKAAWTTLRNEKKLAMSYQTFRMYCRRAGVASNAETAGTQPSRPGTNPAQSRPAVPADIAQRAFRHERVPRKKDIYG
jgi:hypothetical protein